MPLREGKAECFGCTGCHEFSRGKKPKVYDSTPSQGYFEKRVASQELADVPKAKIQIAPRMKRHALDATLSSGPGYSKTMELIFEIRDAEEGGYCARALGHSIFTEGETWEELRANVLEAAALHFEDAEVRPSVVQLHYVKDELIPF